MTATDHTKLSGIAAGAEVNQNAFSTVNVAGTNLAADSKTDTLTITAGNLITLTPTANTDSFSIATTAEQNVIETVKVNNVALTPSSKAVNVTVPTKTSDITNDSGFITIEDVPEGAIPSSTTPLMDGVAAVGTEKAFARGDHKHPSDTSKVNVTETTSSVTSTIQRDAGHGLEFITQNSVNGGSGSVVVGYYGASMNAQNENGLASVVVDNDDCIVELSADDGTNLNSMLITPTSTVINNVVTPSADGDAVNKAYVDAQIGDLELDYTASTRTIILGQTVGQTTQTIDSAVIPEVVAGGNSGLMTGTQATKLAGIATGAEVNVNADWNAVSGDAQILNKPTTISGYGITDAYTKTEIDGKVSGVFHYKGTKATVAQLPSSGNEVGDVWHVTADNGEYAWDGTTWQELGSTVDLSSYYTKTETDTLLGNKVDKVSGKGLSTNDFTTELKNKLDGIASGAQVNVIESIKVNGTAQAITSKAVDISVPVPATSSPLMDGTAVVGTSAKYAKEDHVHPTDTSRAAASTVTEIDGRVTVLENVGATKVEASNTNGNIKINGTETNVYTLPSTVLDEGDILILNCGTASTNYSAS